MSNAKPTQNEINAAFDQILGECMRDVRITPGEHTEVPSDNVPPQEVFLPAGTGYALSDEMGPLLTVVGAIPADKRTVTLCMPWHLAEKTFTSMLRTMQVYYQTEHGIGTDDRFIPGERRTPKNMPLPVATDLQAVARGHGDEEDADAFCLVVKLGQPFGNALFTLLLPIETMDMIEASIRKIRQSIQEERN